MEKSVCPYISVAEKLKLFRPGVIGIVEHYSTGIRKLDEMLGGGLYSGLIFLGARPGMGKSTLALQIASEVAAGGVPVLFYSLEMPAIRMESKILNRALHMEEDMAEITSDWFLRAENMDKKQVWERVEKVQEKIGSRYENLYIKERDRISFSAEDIIADVENFIKITGRKPVVFVDYLQILSACAASRNLADKQKTDENINALSSLSNKHDMVVFVISSLNREAYKNAQKPLQMDSFKETGGIEYSASVILGLQPRNLMQEGYDHEEAMSKPVRELELVFLKQRYGATGKNASVPLDFYPAWDLYKEKGIEEKDRQEKDPQEQKEQEKKRTSVKTEKKQTPGRRVRKKEELSPTPDAYSSALLEKYYALNGEK